MDMTLKRHWSFSDLKPGMIVWLGVTPDDRRIQAELHMVTTSGGIDFFVINGAWNGTLYEQEVTYESGEVSNVIYIVDARGTRHEPVHIVDIEERKPVEAPTEAEIPF